MTKDELEPFLAEIPEVYQDIEINGEVLFKGVRDCVERWDMIKPFIKPNSVVLDLGSSFGYFARKIAKEIPGTLVLSFERDEKSALLQKKLLEQEKLTNVILLNHSLSSFDFARWLQVVEGIDCVLALSVLHGFGPREVSDILLYLSMLSPDLILEMPNENETKAAGHETVKALSPLDQTLKKYYSEVEKLGEIKSHLQDTFRPVYRAAGNVQRYCLTSYFDCPKVQTQHEIVFDDKKWQVDNKEEFISGINVWNLLHFNIIYPVSNWWYNEAKRAYKKVIDNVEKVSDVRPWNLLVTAKGLTAIDYKFPVPDGHPMAYTPDHLEKVLSIFKMMSPEKWDNLLKKS